MAYLRKYNIESVATPAAAVTEKEPVQLDGMTAFKRDDMNDFDIMFAGMGGGKKKGGGKGKKTAKVEVLTHSLDIIANYGLLKLSPPSTKVCNRHMANNRRTHPAVRLTVDHRLNFLLNINNMSEPHGLAKHQIRFSYIYISR